MPSRISRLLTRPKKNKQVEADTERKSSSNSSSSLPPGYDAENRLDPPDPTAGFSNLFFSKEDKKYNFPTPEETIAHLKLLECFHRLRQTIGSTDGLFGISNSLVTGPGIDATETEQLESLAKVAEKRWAIYVSRAVDRFDIWIRNVFADQQMANLDWMEEGGPQAVLYQPQPPLDLSKDNLPPLDVLMVWHAYMLNPRAYLEDCLRNGRVRLWQTRFPWKAVDQRIDRETFAYEPGHLAATLFPNNLLALGLGEEILSRHTRNARTANESLEGIQEIINEALEKHKYTRKAGGRANSRTKRAGTITIHRMMSRYEDNPSPFALDLVGAVIRQGSFIEKMHHIDWLHSPALFGTTKRLVTRYDRFVRIMADGQNMAVPTLDVDLAWHTHQLSPSGYFTYTVQHCKQFIDHDDKVAETTLDHSFEWTSKRYQELYREQYSECVCWYCEARQEQILSASHRIFRTGDGRVSGDDLMYTGTQTSKPSQQIPAHNALRPHDPAVSRPQGVKPAQKHAAELESVYRSACARARRKGKPDPERDDYYYSDAWGCPVYIPAYSPYVEPLV
ncbi:hypothetical protein KC315_g10135 [Hortaea werneckii]|nr:hypothetical protein KC315_g10135 [Hortaea werneckii]KAI7363252.1 hypothetical protein KC354_g6626 [Hortaea werneckii]